MREALALLVDKDSIEKFIYGRTGQATANFINNPERFRSKNTKYEFNIDKANALLDKAGWKKGADGIREKDGKKLKFVFQTSINQPRQKTQAIVKQACQKAGIDIELKAVVGVGVLLVRRRQSRHLSANSMPTCRCTTTAWRSPIPRCSCASSARGRSRRRTTSGRAATSRAGRARSTTTPTRPRQVELDPVKRAALLIKCNELVVNDQVVIPVVSRPDVAA